MNKEMLQRLASKAGVRVSSLTSPAIPTIKLDASTTGDTAGKFIEFNNGETKQLGNSLSIRILRVRKALAGFAEEGGKEVSYNSSEYDSPRNEDVVLYRRESGEDSRVVEVATATELRNKYPLKVVSIVYAILNGNLVKVKVKGASAAGDSGLYAYLDKLRDEGVMTFEVETLVDVALVKKNRAVSYYVAKFKIGKKYTDGYDEVEKYLDTINDIIVSKKSKTVERKETVTDTVDKAIEYFDSINNEDKGTVDDNDVF
jgi:hypothetical protein